MANEKLQAEKCSAKKWQAYTILAAAILACVAVPTIALIVFAASKPDGAIWIQNLILLVTAAIVVRYTRETAKLRKETRNMVEEAQKSREQLKAIGVFDAEIRLYNVTHQGMSASSLADLATNWSKGVRDALWNNNDIKWKDGAIGTRNFLKAKNGDFSKENTEISFENVLLAIRCPAEVGLSRTGPEIRKSADSLRTAVVSQNVEKALEECEFLIRLANRCSEDISRMARQRLECYNRVREVLVGHIAMQKFLTEDFDYGETYLKYFEENAGNEERDLIRKVRLAGKDKATAPGTPIS